MTSPSLSTCVDAARTLALEASHRIMQLRQGPLEKFRKADHSLVTNADHEADRIIRDGLRRAFPDHGILTEESGMQKGSDSEFLWVVDPVDGTRAFAKGTHGFSVMIGLLHNGRPCAGVVADPLEKRLYWAARGEGAFMSDEDGNQPPKPLRVSARRDYDVMPFITSTGFPEKIAEKIRARLKTPWLPSINSVGIKVALLVRQISDIYLNHHAVHFWDTCGPEILLQEAGGVITYLDGSPLSYPMESGVYRHRQATLATNGLRHNELLSILAPIVTEAP